MRNSRSVARVPLGPWIAPVMIAVMISVTRSHDVGVLGLRRAERAHHRRGDVGVARAATGSSGASTATTRSAGVALGGRMRLEVRAQVGLLLGHRLEQQPLLRREVAVDGAERDVGRGRDVAHLHRVEPAVGRELERRVEHPAPARGLAARPARSPVRALGGRHDAKLKHVSISVGKHGRSRRRDCSGAIDHGRCSNSPTSCSRASCRSSRTTRSRRAGELAEVQPGLAFVDAFANSAVVDTDDGLVVVDTSGVFHAKRVHETMRRVVAAAGSTPRSSRTATSTTCSASTSTRRRRARTAGRRRASIAHERDRRRASTATSITAGYNAVINQRQFKAPGLRVADRLPLSRRDLPRRDSTLEVGGERFELHHDRGETDDATWVWVAGAQGRCSRATCSSGRRRTAATRRRCSATRATGPPRSARWPRSSPRCCCPGHGLPIVGADRVRAGARPKAPSCSSRLLDQTLALMNDGARLDDIVHSGARARAPARAPVPAPDLRRARVRRAQHLAATTAAGTTATRRT